MHYRMHLMYIKSMENKEPTKDEIIESAVIEAIQHIDSGRIIFAREVLENLLKRIELDKAGEK
jgi:hypothetical protein